MSSSRNQTQVSPSPAGGPGHIRHSDTSPGTARLNYSIDGEIKPNLMILSGVLFTATQTTFIILFLSLKAVQCKADETESVILQFLSFLTYQIRRTRNELSVFGPIGL